MKNLYTFKIKVSREEPKMTLESKPRPVILLERCCVDVQGKQI